MKSILTVLIGVLASVLLNAQIPNTSFKSGSSTTIEGWNNLSGDNGALSSYKFKSSFRDTTISGDFAKLSYKGDDGGVIQSKFKWEKRSSELSGKFIYIPQKATQRFTVEVTYLNWNSDLLKLDTIAHSATSINPFNKEKFRNYQWFNLTIAIKKDAFRFNDDPDSCIITIKADNGETTDPSTVLLIDELSFGDGVVAGMDEFWQNQVSIFPNPSNGTFSIEGIDGDERLVVLNTNGRIVHQTTAKLSNSIQLQKGLYFVQIESKKGLILKKLTVL